MKKCFIVRENGNVFEGVRFGAPVQATGELVFTTSCGGHMKTLTDPCHQGQIVLQTFPTVGNYGVIPDEQDSDKCHLLGYVVREWCETPSNFRSQGDIDEFLKLHGVAGVYGVDTRQITRIIRECGTLNAAIVDEVTPGLIEHLKVHRNVDAIKAVSTGARNVHPAQGELKCKLALINYGAPHSMIHDLCARGCEVHELPHDVRADEVLTLGADALVLSDGPGDPMDAPACVEQLKLLAGQLPILGVGLGHLLLALSMGGKSYKLKHGHRGANQPIRRLSDGQMYISALNQGYAACETPPNGAEVSYVNFNDRSVAGFEYKEVNATSVQFVPDSSLGPLRTDFIYDQFLGKVAK